MPALLGVRPGIAFVAWIRLLPAVMKSRMAFGVALLLAPPAAPAADAGRIAPDFAALAREAAVTLPPPPQWSPAQNVPSWSIDELEDEFRKHTDTPPRVNMVRTRLLRPDHRWAVEFVRWFRSVQKPLKLRYRDQSWDCDDYANCFVAFADLLVLKAGGSHGGMCVGRASIYYRRKFADVPAGSAHALVLLGTSDGLYLVEPQDGTIVALRQFPNRDTIEELNF